MDIGLWGWIIKYESYIKSGFIIFGTVVIGRLFYGIILFLIKKYFLDKDDKINELFRSRNDHEIRLTILETEHKRKL